MATFRPFRGVRPLPGNVAAVASRPYDVSVGVEPAPTRTDAEIDAAAGAIRAPGGEVPGGAYRDLDQVD